MKNALTLPNNLTALKCLAVVETPAESRAKLDFDEETGLFRLAGVLPAGMAFPLDFGFVPGTLGEDGDPVDILILSEANLPVGCLVEVRLLGLIKADQTEIENGEACRLRNDRIVARLAESRAFANVETLAQLGDAFQEELCRFFKTYNELKGKRFEVCGVFGPEEAAGAVKAGTLRRAKR